MRRRIALAGLAIVVGSLCAVGGPARAADDGTVGVAVGTGRITVSEPLRPGARVDLPPIVVRNPGTLASRYRVRVVPELAQPASRLDRSWIQVPSDVRRLAPGSATRFSLALELPEDAEAGTYEAVVAGEVVDDGALTGPAAGTKVRFQVVPDADRVRPRSGPGPRAIALVVGLALALAAWAGVARRRTGRPA